jgi:hypothetical protein
MANEIYVPNLTAGSSYFFLIRNSAGLTWTGTGNNFAAMASISFSTPWAAEPLLTADATVTNEFYGTFPTAITSPDDYRITIYLRNGANPALSDVTAGPVAVATLSWTGTAEASIAKGTAQADVAKLLGDNDGLTNFKTLIDGSGGTLYGDVSGEVNSVAEPVSIDPDDLTAVAGARIENTIVEAQGS